ncbi:MAG TPA: hypothetical protein ENN23_05355 [Deltaproteobacteria bacterium]|nr:hypothetical protein [Deltaproteobacteria bacterium]
MLIPIIILFVTISVTLIIIGVFKTSRKILSALSIILWLCSLVSAFFVGWAWLERAYSENWAMYGFFFISLPIIITAGVLATVTILAVKVRKIENMKEILLRLYLLLIFLAAQVVVGFFSA